MSSEANGQRHFRPGTVVECDYLASDCCNKCGWVKSAVQRAVERRLEAALKRVAELEEDAKRGLRVAYELTLEAQTVEEACTALVDMVRKARAERDEARVELRRLDDTVQNLLSAFGETYKVVQTERDAALKRIEELEVKK